MNRDEIGPQDPQLREALRALAEEQKSLAPPPAIEDQLLRAWDDAHAARGVRRGGFAGVVLATAATLLLAAAAGYWWMRGATAPSVSPSVQSAATAPSWPSDEALAWLDADPASLQVVRIRVASATLARRGYDVSDPDGDGLVDVEMVVGTDGIAQRVRVAPVALVE